MALANVNFKTVEKAVGKEKALETYREIAKIAGGDPDPNHDGGMDLTGLEPGELAKVEKLLEAPKEPKKTA